MNIILNTFLESIIQLALFTFVPIVCWLIFRRKVNQPFHEWIGIKKPKLTDVKKLLITVITLILFWLLPSKILSSTMADSATTMYSKDGFSLSAVICILLFSFIKTGLSEEVFFRGFIAKRLINAIGFIKGNIIQAIIFGLAHSFIYLSGCGFFITAAIVAETAITAFLIGYINEKLFNGSIIPTWLLHAAFNCIPAFMAFIR